MGVLLSRLQPTLQETYAAGRKTVFAVLSFSCYLFPWNAKASGLESRI